MPRHVRAEPSECILIEIIDNNWSLCPGCDKKCIGKTERRLETPVTEHSKHFETSAVAQHFLNCLQAQYLSHVNVLCDNLISSHLS